MTTKQELDTSVQKTHSDPLGPCDDCDQPAGIRVCTGCWERSKDSLLAQVAVLREALLGLGWAPATKECPPFCCGCELEMSSDPHDYDCAAARAALSSTSESAAAFIARVRRETLEKCAKVAEESERNANGIWVFRKARDIAERIRALADDEVSG